MRKILILAASAAMIMTGCKKEMTESFDLYVGTYGDNLYRTTFTPGTGGRGFSELIPTDNPAKRLEEDTHHTWQQVMTG